MSGLENRILISLFLVRVMAGLINGYINLYIFNVSDTATFQLQGIGEYHLLFHHPYEYLTNIFRTNDAAGYGNFLESSNSFWNNTRSNLIAKMLSIFNIFSGMNFFINSLFYNFLVFFGAAGLYRVFVVIFPDARLILIACIFLLPSAVFFSSGIHRDGLIYLSLAMVIYYLYFMTKNRHYSLKGLVAVLFYLSLLLLLRNFVFITLFPALVAWMLATYKPRNSFSIFIVVYTITVILFFGTGFLRPSLNLPAHVSSRQIDFTKLSPLAGSSININPLYPNFRSFLNNAPQALNHSFMRPYLTEHTNALSLAAGMEILFYEFLFFLFIFFNKKKKEVNPVIYFSVFLTVSMFLVIGYTIPILGAIVRYRSIYFPFILIPAICYTDWAKISRIIHIQKK